MASKAVERSRRQRQETCCWLTAVMRRSFKDKRVVSVGMIFGIGRLIRVVQGVIMRGVRLGGI